MPRRLRCAALVACLICPIVVLAQAPPPPPTAQRDAMKRLDFLVGEWKGEGWAEFAPGQRREFNASETVRPKLDGLLLVVEGLHHAKGGNGAVVHNAFGVLSYDPRAKRYRFQAFTARGNYEETEAVVGDKQFTWNLKIHGFGDVRYTVKLDAEGRWHETGEMSPDGGKNWRKFFEMTLRRTGDGSTPPKA